MKILFLTDGKNDYLADSLLIGLRELFGATVVDVKKGTHNYVTFDPLLTKHIWGKGFTTTRILEDIEVDRTDILSKIKTKYFDLIVYGGIWNYSEYLDVVLESYPLSKIIILDGFDDVIALHSVVNTGVPYFRRELNYIQHDRGVIYSNQKNVFPISFSFPTSKVCHEENLHKTRDVAICDPRNRSTYIYDEEANYYQGYRESYLGVTMKKAGWDAMRHYEILANKCLPYFIDIHDCPETALVSYPKHLCLELNRELGSGETLSNLYDKYASCFFKHFLENNTTKAAATKFIEHVAVF